MARQRHRRPQHVVKAGFIAGREPRQRIGRRRRDGVEDAEQRVRKALVVAGDQFGVVEVVTGIHLDVLVEPPAHVDLALLVEQRDFYAIDLGRVGVDDGNRRVHRLVEIGRTPIACQRRIEHVAEPVDDHGLADLAQHAVVDLCVVVGATAELCQRARGHQDDTAAGLFDCGGLLLVSTDHIIDRPCILYREVVGPGAGKHQRITLCLRRIDRALNQLQRGRPVQPHAALRGVHRLRDAEAEVPDVLAEGHGAVPVDG